MVGSTQAPAQRPTQERVIPAATGAIENNVMMVERSSWGRGSTAQVTKQRCRASRAVLMTCVDVRSSWALGCLSVYKIQAGCFEPREYSPSGIYLSGPGSFGEEMFRCSDLLAAPGLSMGLKQS